MRQADPLCDELARLIAASAAHMALLRHVAALDLPDGWIGAGFVRDVVWNHCHGRPADLPRGARRDEHTDPPWSDIDVIWFDPTRADPVVDDRLDAMLLAVAPDIRWSVANQARMHRRNGAPPYTSTADAMTNWPETATAVAVRLITGDRVEVLAPLGLDDLFGLILRPTPFFLATGRLPVMTGRIRDKRWLERWPKLVLAPEAMEHSPPPGL